MEAHDIIKNLVYKYVQDFSSIRSEDESASNLDFHRENGLWIKGPTSWQIYDSIGEVVNGGDAGSVLVIYSDSKVYQWIANMIAEKDVSRVYYISWHEIFFAMYSKSKDIREVQRVNQMLRDMDTVFVLDATKIDPEVINHLQAFVTGCLVCLG